ncbi:hypothetical protein [Mesobacillus subterraneus]|uniref:Uncharacterized protein n=1 Tax=Mesobacillus subterraneus TaxID=285983 RepID=A0A3R9DTM0_9BACI|nr:hypothetical protein [Mesobacillus subterraneus]RSD27097.1 hypothetical protein EJA10_11170 [Mesobacillus subterraneus]
MKQGDGSPVFGKRCGTYGRFLCFAGLQQKTMGDGFINRTVPVFSMEVWKVKKCIMLIAATLFVTMGCAGCMSSESKVLAKLEEKYNQKFTVEGVKEGSKIFAQMYGKDRLTVHPEGNPEVVFLAQEDKDDKEVVNDNYVLAKWAEDLKAKLAGQIEKELPPGTPYKVLLRIAPDKYDKSMVNMSFENYLEESDKDFSVVLVAGINTAYKPDLSTYKESIYNLFKLMKGVGSERYTVSIGFVGEDVSDYVRTSLVNNIAWTNLKAKVYGEVNIDNQFDGENPGADANPSLIIKSPDDVPKHYESIENNEMGK